MIDSCEITVNIVFNCNSEAEKVYEAIRPEVNDHNFSRSSIQLNIENNNLKIEISASDINSAMANINSFLRWIDLSVKTVEKISFEKKNNMNLDN